MNFKPGVSLQMNQNDIKKKSIMQIDLMSVDYLDIKLAFNIGVKKKKKKNMP